MYIYEKFLFVFYMILIIAIAFFIVINIIKSKRLTPKIIGSIALIMFILRIFMIR